MSGKLKKFKTAIGAIVAVAIVVAVSAAIIAFIFKKDDKKPVFIFGKTFLWVETASMEPSIEERSFILSKKYRGEALKSGDVITFICRDASSPVYGHTITHRIVEVTADGYKTKGDNPLSARDEWTVKSEDVLAVYVKNLKAVTVAGRVFASPAGLALIIGSFALAFAFIYVPDVVKALRGEDYAEKRKQKEIDKRVKEEVEKMLKERGNGGQ